VATFLTRNSAAWALLNHIRNVDLASPLTGRGFSLTGGMEARTARLVVSRSYPRGIAERPTGAHGARPTIDFEDSPNSPALVHPVEFLLIEPPGLGVGRGKGPLAPRAASARRRWHAAAGMARSGLGRRVGVRTGGARAGLPPGWRRREHGNYQCCSKIMLHEIARPFGNDGQRPIVNGSSRRTFDFRRVAIAGRGTSAQSDRTRSGAATSLAGLFLG
jgi:hypothetical protein